MRSHSQSQSQSHCLVLFEKPGVHLLEISDFHVFTTEVGVQIEELLKGWPLLSYDEEALWRSKIGVSMPQILTLREVDSLDM